MLGILDASRCNIQRISRLDDRFAAVEIADLLKPLRDLNLRDTE